MISPQSLELEILGRKTQLLFRRAWLGQLVTIINASVLAFLVWPTRPMLIWWSFATVLAFARLVMVRRFLGRPEGSDVVGWRRRFVIGATLAGTLWGTGYLLLGWDGPE